MNFPFDCTTTYRRPFFAALFCVLLVMPAGCGSMFAGKSEYQQMKDKEQADIDVFTEAGGKAVKEGYSLAGFTGSGWKIDLSGVEIKQELLDKIIELVTKKGDEVVVLNFKGSTITDDQLAALDEAKTLGRVYQLDLSNTAITDAGLDKVKDICVLSELNLSGSKATAAAAKRLGDRKIAHPQTPEPFKRQPKVDIAAK